ncbi:metallophosphoesterase [Cytobacillus oceanisediminis]|uniref:metallophosphoesterase n=1 Tax=Cytobacillus oceanisediminis TaxID=665099 RepID=UPI0023DC094C|nr:metallophosphoesterase [Cytobacillus oceanisediminis]MDF2040171.1 metallophosphoesterase [Cytobacillus oceanisediminis]
MALFFTLILSAVFCIIIYKANKNTKKVTINTISVSRPNISVSGDNIKILHISDMHLENISVSPDELFAMISKQPVDLIALTGDFLDRKRSIPKLAGYLHALNKTNPKHGMYAVFGNHDYVLKGKNFETLKNTLEENGCKTLQNEHVTIQVNGENLNIIGIDNYSTKHSDVKMAYKGVSEGCNLILTHDPNVVLEMENIPFDYLLSGHFHGGQIHWPKPYHLIKMGKLVRMKMVKGLHYHGGKPFYISEGLGQTGVNIRIGSRPEITFHEIS